MDRFVEIQLWDFLPQMEHVFLGESNVDISKAFLSDNASWYRLEDPKGLRGACMAKSSNVSPRGSLANADVGRLIRRSDFGIQRSISDDVDSIGDATSLLHPDTAWFAGSRRGSSQSEQLEVEVYQLNKDFSRSLPGSRRSSFQNAEDGARSGEATPPVIHVPSRRRSSIAIRNKDPEEILRSLKRELGRTMSLEKPEKKLTSRSKFFKFIFNTHSKIDPALILDFKITLYRTSPPYFKSISSKITQNYFFLSYLQHSLIFFLHSVGLI